MVKELVNGSFDFVADAFEFESAHPAAVAQYLGIGANG